MNLVTYIHFLSISLVSALPMLIDVFKHKSLHFATLFHCYSHEKAVLMERYFNKYDIRISSVSIANNESIRNTDKRVGVVLNTTCQDWTSVFSNFEMKLFKKAMYTWLIITEDFSSTCKTLSDYPIEVDSDVLIISKDDSVYVFHEVYNTGFYTNGQFRVQSVGFWKSKLHIHEPKRFDLSGVILKSAVVVTRSIVNVTFEDYLTKSKLEVDSLHKLKYFTLLKYLRDMYNFSYILQRTNSWGYLRNGLFDGMVGTLQRREVDLGGTPVFIRADRAKLIDYTAATWPSKPCFILRHPKHPGGYSTIYTRPLSDIVWWSLLALLTIAGAILCLLLKLKVIEVEGDEGDSSTSLALLSIWSAVCQQGMSVSRQASSVKLVVFTTFLLSLTVYQYYNATVVSTLLREPPKTIKTLDDLLKSKLKAGVENALYNIDFFKRTTDPVAREMFSKKITVGDRYNFYPPEVGMALVKKGGYAFHVDPAFAYPIIKRTFTEREICELQEVSLYPPQNMFAVMKKGSPYRKHLTYGIRKMFESGLMHRLKSIWDEPKPPCVRTPDSSIFTVTVREFSTPLLLLVFGMIMSFMLLAAEVIVARLIDKRLAFKR